MNDQLEEYIEITSWENTWPFYLVLYSIGIIVTIVAVRRNKKKKQAAESEDQIISETDEIR